MRLNCETEIVYRMLQYHNKSSGRSKTRFTTLTLYSKPDEKKPKPATYLLVGYAKNPAGTKYRVDGNIERLFTRFVNEGKAGIRIRKPEHDVIISKAESTELYLFLRLLHRAQQGDDQTVFPAPPLNFTRTEKELAVRGEEDYPIEGFPTALKSLTIEGCNLVEVGMDVLALANLRVLKLKGNKLHTLPTQLSNLPLECLTASGNLITELHPELFERRLRSCLVYLDVSHNQLTVLPETLCGAHRLKTLVVGYNRIHKLPDGLGYLSLLRCLDLTSNTLTLLPASLLNLKLERICIWNNPLSPTAGQPLEHTAVLQQVPWPLTELAARAVAAVRRVELTAEDVPQSLLRLLHTATPCYGCQRPVFPATAASMTLRVNPRCFAASFGALEWATTHDHLVPVRAFICSIKCVPH